MRSASWKAQDLTSLDQALADIDALHAQDPTQIDGVPAELLYARRMSDWLQRLDAHPSPELRLAVRAQHLLRWELSRESFPDGRVGYKRWRAEQARRHAAVTAEILEKNGFSPDSVERVSALIQKRRLQTDPEAQTLEDAACLVFLEFEFSGFAHKHPVEKVVQILQKTWLKMSSAAREQALRMNLADRERDLLARAVSGG
jgi:hypothetical protein